MSTYENNDPRKYGSGEEKIGFGKYAEWTLAQLYAADTNYLRWAVNKGAIDKDCFCTIFGETDATLQRKKIYIDSVVWFGKHKGKVFSDAYAEDVDYFEWCMGDEGFLEMADGSDPSIPSVSDGGNQTSSSQPAGSTGVPPEFAPPVG